jgi:hypothetical protein
MATGNSVNVTVEMDSTAGGSLVDYTSQIDKVGDFEIKNGVIVNTPFGTAAVAKALTGMIEAGPLTIEGEITDTAAPTGFFKMIKAARGGVTRTMKLTYLTGEYISVEVLVTAVKRAAGVGTINRFAATVEPTGAITES